MDADGAGGGRRTYVSVRIEQVPLSSCPRPSAASILHFSKHELVTLSISPIQEFNWVLFSIKTQRDAMEFSYYPIRPL
jgi:hypothetical protein